MEIRQVYQWADRVLATVFPPRCLLCLDPGQHPGLDLCQCCETDLPWVDGACPTCASPCPGPTLSPCAACQAGPWPFDRAVAAFHYAFPADALVRQLKYRGGLAAGRVLGTLLARQVRRRGPGHVDALVPVPLHRRREARRGFNQALEIARVVGRELDLPVADGCCARSRDTAEQARLDANGRAANVRGAFCARRVPPRRIAIVDDVLTTGSTVAELARVLREAGAERVEVWVAARAGAQR